MPGDGGGLAVDGLFPLDLTGAVVGGAAAGAAGLAGAAVGGAALGAVGATLLQQALRALLLPLPPPSQRSPRLPWPPGQPVWGLPRHFVMGCSAGRVG